MLTNVLHVIHQESESQTVSAQMVSMITEIPVLVVLITVPLVLKEMNVPLVPPSEKTPQNVDAQPVTMILVLSNVKFVPQNVKPVPLITSVSPVTTHLTELLQIVNVQLVGKITLTELIVLKNHIQMVLTT
jgi:hypothetical protein